MAKEPSQDQGVEVHQDPAWTKLLFGDEPWPMLLALMACGLLVYLLWREAVPAILAVVLLGLAANAWVMRHKGHDDGKVGPP